MIGPIGDHGGALPCLALPSDGRPVVLEVCERFELPLPDDRLACYALFRRRPRGHGVIAVAVATPAFAPGHYNADPSFAVLLDRPGGRLPGTTVDPLAATVRTALVGRFIALDREARARAWSQTTVTIERVTAEGRMRLVTVYERATPDTYYGYQMIGEHDGVPIDPAHGSEFADRYFHDRHEALA